MDKDKRRGAMKRNALRIVVSIIKDQYGFVIQEDEIEMSQADAESLLRDKTRRAFRDRIEVDIKMRGPTRMIKATYIPAPVPAAGTY